MKYGHINIYKYLKITIVMSKKEEEEPATYPNEDCLYRQRSKENFLLMISISFFMVLEF